MRIAETAILSALVSVLAACSDVGTYPTAASDVAVGGFSSEEDPSAPYFCPEPWIKYAWIPGTVPPKHGVQVGNGSGFFPLQLDKTLGTSTGGIPKGRYAVPMGGGPWKSADDSIAVVAGTVDGYCRYTPYPVYEWPWAFNGQLGVYDSDVDYIWLLPREPEKKELDECDDVFTDTIEECSGTPSGGSTGTPGSSEGYLKEIEYPSSNGTIVCDLTDWFDTSGGKKTYIDTDVNLCWYRGW